MTSCSRHSPLGAVSVDVLTRPPEIANIFHTQRDMYPLHEHTAQQIRKTKFVPLQTTCLQCLTRGNRRYIGKFFDIDLGFFFSDRITS